MADNIKVVIKVRPLIKRELIENLKELWTISENSIYPIEQNRDGDNNFTFDYIFDCQSQTRHVYDIVARPIVEAAVDGINGTIFAYGQTSSGKTYTMMGDQDSPGIVPLAIQNIFQKIESMTDRDFLLRVSYIEIYNEKIRDLLDINSLDLKIHEDYHGQVYVKSKEEVASTTGEVLELMKKGNRNRTVGETQMNERSSRSHTIFYIIIESRRHQSIGNDDDDDSVNVSQLNLVDLAGSERAAQTGATKQRLREGGHINKSLSTLGLVIRQLSDPSRPQNTFISFRDSKLTYFLRNSLGGNSKTGIICAVTPAVFDETQSTLMFAMSAKFVQNIPKVNAVVSDATLIKKLTKEMAILQEELESKRNIEVDNKKLQEQLDKFRHMILMGNAESVPFKNQKAEINRRRTWCAPPSSLPTIREHSDSQSSVRSNDMENLFKHPGSYNITNRPKVNTRNSCDILLETPKTQKVVDIIELDDTPEGSPQAIGNAGCVTPPICSPNHKCFSQFQTPPCVLKYRAQHAEKEYNELQELTSLEKMFEPEKVELMNEITQLRKKNQDSLVQIETQNQLVSSLEEKIQRLNENIESVIKEKNDSFKTRKNFEKEIEYLKNVNVDLKFENENSTERHQIREQELRASLNEARDTIKKLETKSETSMVSRFLGMSRDMTLINSDLDDTQNEIIKLPLNPDPNPEDINLAKYRKEIEDISKELEVVRAEIKTKDTQIDELQIKLQNYDAEKVKEHNLLLNAESNTEGLALKTRVIELEELIKKKDASHHMNVEYAKSDAEGKLNDLLNENTMLKQDIAQREDDILNNKHMVTALQAELELSKKSVIELNNIISNINESMATLKEENDNLISKTSQMESLHLQIQSLHDEICSKDLQIKSLQKSDVSTEMLQKDAYLKDLQIKSLQEDVDLRDLQIKALKEDVDSRDLQIKALKGDVDSSDLQIKSLQEDIDSRDLQIKSLQEDVDSRDLQIKSLQEDIDSKELQIKSLQEDVNSKDLQIKSLQEDIDSKELQIKSLQEDVNSKDLQIKSLQEDVNSKDLHIKSLQEDVNSKDLHIKSLQEDVNSKDLQINSLQEDVNSKDLQIKSLQEDIDSKELQVKSLQEDVNSKDLQIKSLQEDVNSKDLHIKSLQEDVNSKDLQINLLLEDVNSKDLQIKSLQEDVNSRDLQVKSLQEDIDSKELQIKSLQEDVNYKDLQIKSLQEDDSLRDLISTFQIQIKKLEDEANDRNEQLRTNVDKFNKLESELKLKNQVEEIIKELEQNLSSAKDKIENLTAKHSDFESEKQLLRIELEKLTGNVSDLKDENNNLKEILTQKDLEIIDISMNADTVAQSLQLIIREYRCLEENYLIISKTCEKFKLENMEYVTELGNLKKNLDIKCDQNMDVDESFYSIPCDMINKDVDGKSTDNETLKNSISSLSNELSESNKEILSNKIIFNEMAIREEYLKERINFMLAEIKSITNNISNRIEPSRSNLNMDDLDCSEMDRLAIEVSKIIKENILLRNENILSENKENVSLVIEKSPFKSKHNLTFPSMASPLDSNKFIKASKMSIPHSKSKNEILKDIIHIIDNEDCGINADNLNISIACGEDYVLVVNKIVNLKTSLKKACEDNCILKQEILKLDDSLKETKKSLTLVNNGLNDVCLILSTNFSNCYNSIKDDILSIKSHINRHVYVDAPLTLESNISVEAGVPNSTNNDVNQSDLNILKFVDFLERNTLKLCSLLKLNPEDFSEEKPSRFEVSDAESKFTSLKRLYGNMYSKIENMIIQQNKNLTTIESEYEELKNDKSIAQIELQALCEETEQLYKKVMVIKSETIVADAESTLKSSILSATEHYHNNLHSTIVNSLSFIKDQLLVLQAFLQNPDITQRELVDIYCNITNPNFELLETPIKHCTGKTSETKSSGLPFALFKVPEENVDKVDRSMCTDSYEIDKIKSDYESKCLENKELLDKIESLELIKNQFDELVNERDSLSSQLIDSLEDVDDLKNKCIDLSNKLDLCVCKNQTQSFTNSLNVSVQTQHDSCLDENNANPKLCFDYVMEKILQIKSDFIKPSDNLVDLITIYSDMLNNKVYELQDQVNILNEKTISLQSQLDCKIAENLQLDSKVCQIKGEITLLQIELSSKCQFIQDIECKLNENVANIIELTKKLEDQTNLYNSTNTALVEQKIKNEDLQKLLNEAKDECNNKINKIHAFETEKIDLMNQINELETKVNQAQQKVVETTKLNDELLIKIQDLERGNAEIAKSQDENIYERAKIENEFITLDKKLKELEDEKRSLNETIIRLKITENELLGEQSQLRSLLNEKEASSGDLQNEMELKAVEIQKLTELNVKFESELEQLRVDKSNILDNMKELKSKLSLSLENASKLEADFHQSTEDYKQLSQLCDSLKNIEQHFTVKLNNLNEKHQLLTNELETKQIELMKLSKNVEELQSDANEKNKMFINATAETRALSNLLNELKEEKLKYLHMNKLLEEEKLSLLSNNESLSKILSEKDVEIEEKIHEISLLKSNFRNTTSLQLENEKLQHEIHKKNENICELESQMATLNNKLNGVTNQLVELSSLKSVNNILETRVSDLQTELTTLLRFSSKSRSDHLHLKRQSLHDMHRNLSSSNDDNDVSMEDHTANDDENDPKLQELKNRSKELQDKYQEANSRYLQSAEELYKVREEYNIIEKSFMELQRKYEDQKKYLISVNSLKVDASTNTSNTRTEDNMALMDIFVDKLTHNQLKEKYDKMVKLNEDLRLKIKEQADSLRRLHHAQQNTAPHESVKDLNRKIENLQQELITVKNQLDIKENEYKEMDAEYNTCVDLYHENIRSYNVLSSEKCLLEAELKNLQEELKELRELKKNSPGRDLRKKRLDMHDSNRGLSVSTTDSFTNTSPEHKGTELYSQASIQKCVECESNKVNLEELKMRHDELVTRLSVQPLAIPALSNTLASAAGSGVVQSQQLSNVMQENTFLKMKLAKYKEMILKIRENRRPK